MKYILQIPASLGIGGMEKVARDLGLYADPDQYEVHYIVFGQRVGEYEREVVAHGCKVFHLEEPSHGYRNFLKNLKRMMSETRYEVVHAHTMFNIGWIMLAAKQMHVPVRVSHAHSALDNGGGLKVRCYESLMRHLILKNATDLVACGEKAGIRLYGKKAFLKRGNLILNGVNTLKFRFNEEGRNRIRKQLGVESRFVIGHAGHLAKVKNQAFLIELMPEILKKRTDAVLLLLGDGPDRQMLEEKAEQLGIRDRVIMTGNVRNVHEYLSAMDVFAFPSLFEGMPLSMIEVQANGLPCILSTGVPQDVYLTDLIHPLELSARDEWIECICKAKRTEPARYAQRLKEEGFDVQSVMGRIYKIYERAL